ncbi:MAG TPA: glycosyltransferase family 1 protein [Gammaproteobacteria bacterium]|nr:glycosyltransferase family 1 protein [Gammaproteobacteria bacterium]
MATNIAVNGISLLAPLTGVGQYTYNLIGEIEKDPGFQPWFFYGPVWDTRRIDQAALESRLKAERVSRIRNLLRTFVPNSYAIARHLQQRYFSRGVKKHAIQLYHEPNFVPLRFDGPIINTIHDLSILRFPETHPKERVRAIGDELPAAIERSDVVITVSEFIAREIIETFSVDPSKVRAIHNGVSEQFRPRKACEVHDCLAKHGLTYGRYLLAVGTLEPRKNITSLIRAYEKMPPGVRRRFPLALAGMKGWHYGELGREMEPLVAADEIKLLGYLSDDELPQVYAGSSMLVYPSIYEGFGLPPLEAMACGVPVIASNRASLPEVVGDAGVLVEPYDIDAIAEAIVSLIDDAGERERLGRVGLERSRGFSWQKCARETLAVYRQALNV